jgi:DNA-binding GntR family transcriptional regulator
LVLDVRYRLAPVRAVERLEPVVATAREPEVPGVVDGAPLLLIERIVQAAGDVSLEFARGISRSDRTRVLIEGTRRRWRSMANSLSLWCPSRGEPA